MDSGHASQAVNAKRLRAVVAPIVLTIATTSQAWQPLHDGSDGATCDYHNRGGLVSWRHRQGDWRDAAGAAQGNEPYASANAQPSDDGRAIRFDVTTLVREWMQDRLPNDGFLIRGQSSGGTVAILFHSREVPDESLRPQLVITLADRTERLRPVADTTLDCTTYQSLGTLPTLTADRIRRLLVQFDLARLQGGEIESASLELTASKTYGNVALGVFAVQAPLSATATGKGPETPGLAARYRRDRGVTKDPAVVMATGFDSPSWRNDWSYVNPRGVMEIVRDGNALGFERLEGAALRVGIPAGQNLGLDMGYRFRDKLGSEPEEVYFRYYLRLGSDWRPTVDGGKLPGISATNTAGWGGRKSDGVSGWSMRGLFAKSPAPGNPLHELTAIGTYAYHADMKDHWGDGWLWSRDGLGLLERGRWYCLEQYFKVNRPGQKDGVMRAWVDGRLAFEKTDVHVRDLESLKIEQIWMNVYHGGTATAPHDLHLFIDNVVIARKYIGPMGE
jgi:hypothetical protein